MPYVVNKFLDTRDKYLQYFTENDVEPLTLTVVYNKYYIFREYAIVPERTEEGYAIICARFADTSPWNYDMIPASKIFMMVLDSLMHTNPPKGIFKA